MHYRLTRKIDLEAISYPKKQIYLFAKYVLIDLK